MAGREEVTARRATGRAGVETTTTVCACFTDRLLARHLIPRAALNTRLIAQIPGIIGSTAVYIPGK